MKRHFYTFLPPGLTLSLVPADLFPWFLLNVNRITKISVRSMILYLLAMSVGILNGHRLLDHNVFLMMVTFSYPLIVFTIFKSISSKLYLHIHRIFMIYFMVTMALGLVQSTGTLSSFTFWNYLFPRGSLGNFSDIGGRGVSLFAAEPSKAALEVSFLYLFLMTSCSKYFKAFLTVAYFSLIILLLKTIIGLMLGLLIVLVIARRKFVFLTLFVIFIYLFSRVIGEMDLGPNRMLEIFSSTENAKYFFNFIYEQSGHRAASLHTTYLSFFFNPFGYGLGNWNIAQLKTVSELDLSFADHAYYFYVYNGQYVPQKSEGFIPNFIAELGILGMIFLFTLALRYQTVLRFCSSSEKSLIYFCLLSLLFFAPVGHPYPFLFLGLIYGKYQNKT